MDCIKDNDLLIFDCPHCNLPTQVLIAELACRIFRHASYFEQKNDFRIPTNQVDPHLPQEQCEQLVREDRVIGCCKPFEIIVDGDIYKVQTCEYK